MTKFTPEEFKESTPAQLIWFVPACSRKIANDALGFIAKEYITKKADDNMEVKLKFLVASEVNDASESVRSLAELSSDNPLLTILDIAHNRVRKIKNNSIDVIIKALIQPSSKFIYICLSSFITL